MYLMTNSLTESPQIKSWILLSYLCSESSWMKTLSHFQREAILAVIKVEAQSGPLYYLYVSMKE
jgi:hypothetical protein